MKCKQLFLLVLVLCFGFQLVINAGQTSPGKTSENRSPVKPRPKKKVSRRVAKNQAYKLSPREQFWSVVGAIGAVGLALLALFWERLPKRKTPERDLSGECNFSAAKRYGNPCWYYAGTIFPIKYPEPCGLEHNDSVVKLMRDRINLGDFVLAITDKKIRDAIYRERFANDKEASGHIQYSSLEEVSKKAGSGSFGSSGEFIDAAKFVYNWMKGKEEGRRNELLCDGSGLRWNFLKAVAEQNIVVIERTLEGLNELIRLVLPMPINEGGFLSSLDLNLLEEIKQGMQKFISGQKTEVVFPICIHNFHWFCLVLSKDNGALIYQTYDSMYPDNHYLDKELCLTVKRLLDAVLEKLQANPTPEAPPAFAESPAAPSP